MSKTPQTKKGFTLIELLVVIAIIGLLSSIVLASLNTARKKGRDARRLSDMKQIGIALNLFFGDKGHYPGTPENVSGNPGEYVGIGDDIDIALAPYFNGPIPIDPSHNGTTYYYSYDPQHNVCKGGPTINTGAVYAFNKAEATSNIRKDTTCGSNMNQQNADYNVVIYPVAP